MAEDSLKDLEIYTLGTQDNSVNTGLRNKIGERREEVINILENIAVKNDFYDSVANDAWSDISSRVHSPEKGIPEMPRIFVIPEDKKAQIEGLKLYYAKMQNELTWGAYFPEIHSALIFTDGDPVTDAQRIHHELDHAMAQFTFVDNGKGKLKSLQAGFSTIHGLHFSGQVFEEGFAVYQSIKYIKTRFRKNHQDLYDEHIEKYRGEFEKIEVYKDKNRVSSAILLKTETVQYEFSAEIVGNLINGMKAKYPDFESELFEVRLDPNLTRSLMDKIDGVYGDGMTRRIFQAKIEDTKEIMEILSVIKDKNNELR